MSTPTLIRPSVTSPAATPPTATPPDATSPAEAPLAHPAAAGASAALLPVVGADALVPLVTGGHARLVHLDHAASAPALASVAATVAAALPWYGSVHRGAGYASTVSSELLETARADIRSFVGGRPDDVVVITRNTTDALTLLASCVPDDVTVVTLDVEHHANLLPWRRGRVIHVATPRRRADVADAFDTALATIDGRTLIAVTAASNVTGETLPLAEIAAVARRHGARLAVDAAQLVAHRPLDIAALGIDWVAFSGHKLYAPFGAGALVGRRDWLDAAQPYLPGGGATASATLDDVTWTTSPARHEGGTPNLVGAIAIAAACRALTAVGFDDVVEHERALTERLFSQLAVLDGVDTLSLFEPSGDRLGIAAIVVAEPSLIAAALSAEYGVATRDGAFCAHPLLRRLHDVDADAPVPNALRASLGVGTTTADIDTFTAALGELLRNGPRWTYADDRQRLVPNPDPRPRPDPYR